MLKYFFICVVLCLAFASFVAFITKLFKGTAISIATGIMLSMGFEYLIFTGIGRLINFDLTNYLIVCNITEVQDMKNPLLVGILSIIVYNVLGIILTEKRDAI